MKSGSPTDKKRPGRRRSAVISGRCPTADEIIIYVLPINAARAR